MKINCLMDIKVTLDCQLSVGLLSKAKAGKNDLGRNTVERICNLYTYLNKGWIITGTILGTKTALEYVPNAVLFLFCRIKQKKPQIRRFGAQHYGVEVNIRRKCSYF